MRRERLPRLLLERRRATRELPEQWNKYSQKLLTVTEPKPIT